MALLRNYIGTLGIQVHSAAVVGASIVKGSGGICFCLYVIGTSLYCRESETGGYSWEDAVTVVTESYSGADGIVFDAAIDSSGNIHVVYSVRTGTSGAKRTLYHIIRDSGTEIWSTKEDIYGSESTIYCPKIAIGGSDDVHCIYHRGTLGSASVKYIRRTSGTWGSEANVATHRSKDTSDQDICIDGNGYLHVVYGGASTVPYLYYKLNNGSWQSEETLAGTGTNKQTRPAVMVESSNNVHVVWSGKGYGTTNPTVSQICYITGTTGSWGSVSALTDVSQPQGTLYGLYGAINDAGDIDVCWTGSQWSTTNLGWNTGNHIKYSSSAWGSVEVLSDYNIARVWGMLWAKYPSTANAASGFMALMSGSTAAVPKVFPTETISRVTNLIHRYNRAGGVYTLEMALGEVTSDFGLPEWATRPQSSTPDGEQKEVVKDADIPTIVRKEVEKQLPTPPPAPVMPGRVIPRPDITPGLLPEPDEPIPVEEVERRKRLLRITPGI